MRFLRTKLLIFFMILAAGATFYHFGDPEKLLGKSIETLEKTPLKGIVQKTQDFNKNEAGSDLNDALQNAQVEISQFSSKAEEVKEHAGNILGDSKILESSTDATGNEIPLHEKTLEYGKYVYCKSVVNDYEKSNSL